MKFLFELFLPKMKFLFELFQKKNNFVYSYIPPDLTPNTKEEETINKINFLLFTFSTLSQEEF